MALGTTLTLADSSAANQTFNLQQFVANGADYIESDATSDVQRSVGIRHSNVGKSQVKGRKPTRRHLIQMIHSEYNSTLGITERFTVNVTITRDSGNTAISATEEADAIAFAKNFLGNSTYMAAVLRDES